MVVVVLDFVEVFFVTGCAVVLALSGFDILESVDLRRDALFTWMILFFAALSTVEIAFATDFPVFVFLADLIATFRAKRISSFCFSRFLSWRNFFIADLITGILKKSCIRNLVILT